MEETSLKAVKQFASLCKKVGAKHAVFGGDAFEAIGRVLVSTLHATYDAVASLQEQVELTWLLGNHGRGDKGMKSHADHVFSDLPNVVVVDAPTVIRYKEDPKLRLTCIPYTGDQFAFVKALQAVAKTDRKKGDRNVLVIHEGINGAEYTEDGYIESEGLAPGNHLFEDFELVLSGHFHHHQTLKAGGSTIVYIGSPYQQKFNHKDTTCGFLVVDTKTLKWKHHPTSFPQFVQVELTTQDDVKELADRDLSGNYVRAARKSIGLDVTPLQDMKALELEIVNDLPVTIEERLQVSPEAGIKELVAEWVRIAGPKGTEHEETCCRLRMLGEALAKKGEVEL